MQKSYVLQMTFLVIYILYRWAGDNSCTVYSDVSRIMNSICNGEGSGSVYPCGEEESVLLVPDFWGLDSTVLRTVLFCESDISV